MQNAYRLSPRQLVYFKAHSFKKRQRILHDNTISGKASQAEGRDFEGFLRNLDV
jgi:hypothetical protein